jgi:hypothetical protein
MLVRDHWQVPLCSQLTDASGSKGHTYKASICFEAVYIRGDHTRGDHRSERLSQQSAIAQQPLQIGSCAAADCVRPPARTHHCAVACAQHGPEEVSTVAVASASGAGSSLPQARQLDPASTASWASGGALAAVAGAPASGCARQLLQGQLSTQQQLHIWHVTPGPPPAPCLCANCLNMLWVASWQSTQCLQCAVQAHWHCFAVISQLSWQLACVTSCAHHSTCLIFFKHSIG